MAGDAVLPTADAAVKKIFGELVLGAENPQQEILDLLLKSKYAQADAMNVANFAMFLWNTRGKENK